MDRSIMTSNTPKTNLTLVIGGTGKTGRRVVERLEARGYPTRIGVPSAEPGFNWEERASWVRALHRVRAAYIVYYPDVTVPGAVETIGAFADLAVACEVSRLVLLTGRGKPAAEAVEARVRESGAELTILRSAFFNQNFSENLWIDDVRRGVVALPSDGVREPFIDANDLADVAVAALTENGHAGQLYELTGPRLLTFADAIVEIAKAAGRDIRYEPLSLEQYAVVAAAQGVPKDVVDVLTYVFGTVLDGRNAHLADGVQRALGRKPRDFAEYARDVAATGVWNVATARAAS
jgi:uncharacterized protein YbjT (DUF2867 family)